MVNDKQWWIKFISIGVILVSAIILGIYKAKNPDTDIKTIIYILIIVSTIGLIGLFSKQIKKYLSHKDEKEDVMSKSDITQIIINYAHSQKNNNLRRTNPIQLYKTDTVGSDVIYAIKVFLNLDDEAFIVVINASFKEREPVYLSIDSKEEEIENQMNKIARKPNLGLTREEIQENSLTGNKITIKTTTPLTEKKEEEQAI